MKDWDLFDVISPILKNILQSKYQKPTYSSLLFHLLLRLPHPFITSSADTTMQVAWNQRPPAILQLTQKKQNKVPSLDHLQSQSVSAEIQNKAHDIERRCELLSLSEGLERTGYFWQIDGMRR